MLKNASGSACWSVVILSHVWDMVTFVRWMCEIATIKIVFGFVFDITKTSWKN